MSTTDGPASGPCHGHAACAVVVRRVRGRGRQSRAHWLHLGVLTRKVLSAAAVALAVLAGGRALTGQQAQDGPPYTPAQSMALLEIEPGLRVELVASEPDVQSPVAMDIDEDGRLFVVEMPGYPLDVSPTGRVVLLEDSNADGTLDKRTIFADNLRLPSGIMRHKRGVLVTSPPDLLYFEDVNGDGRADVREVVLTGFARTNPQHAVNHPVYGLDNWIYLAHSGGSQPVIYADLFGDQGKDLTFPGRPEVKGLDSRGRGVRLKPDAFLVEGLSSRTQYGNAFDVYGRFFAHNNSIHQRHEVLAARYAERNPHLLLPTAMAEISDHGNNNILPITHGARFDLLTEPGQFTSACGLTVYTGGAFPDGYEGTTLVAEPVHNLVHRDVLTPKGATFTASRARADKEFLASRDAWFRPVNFSIGPDGALYVIDYYRPYIEHPEWASSDLQKSPEVLSTGKDRGRIYRIVSATTRPGAKAPAPRLGSATDDDLVQALAHTNSWWRRTAQRLLVSKGRRDAVPALERLAQTRPTALGRLHALWTLEGLDRLPAALVRQALTDPDAGIRENAIILAERSLKDPATIDALLGLVDDPDPRVRFQLLATLGFVDTPASRAAQDRLLLRDIEDEWLQLAALSASSDRAMDWFARALDPTAGLVTTESPGRARFLDRLGGVVAARQKDAEIARVVAVVTDRSGPAGDWWRASLLEGLARGTTGAAGKKALAATQRTLLALATGGQPRLRRAAVTLLTVSGITPGADATAAVQRAARAAGDGAAAADTRVDAIALLALADAPAHRATFERVIVSTEPEAVQLAGVAGLGRIPGAATPAFLLRSWPALASPVRSAAATVVLARRDGALAMLDALERGTVKVWMLNFWHKRSLIMHRDAAIRAAARTVLEESPAARAQRMSRYAAALGGRGDAARGAEVFARNCAMCHQVDGAAGLDVGPDLSTVRHQPVSVLLANILEPNRSIAQHYETYQVERVSGEALVGIIGDQSPTSITFRQGPGQSTTVKRGDIKQMTVVPQSIMPESFDQQITSEDMAHLLAYLTAAPRPSEPPAMAAALLDDSRDQASRERLARDAAPRAAAVVGALVDGLPDDEAEEYRRIPWIWRVAVAAGRAKDEPALQQLLDASMPPRGGRLRDWQAVVLGGGVVMGLSQAGAWPADVMAPWLAADAGRAARWQDALTRALAMCNDVTVRNGTRYDALRMIAVLPWDRAGATLVRYLSNEVDPELQMGAIGGLSDLQDERAAEAIVQHFPGYTESNRRHAINALLRTGARRATLRAAIARGLVRDEWLTPEQRQRLQASGADAGQRVEPVAHRTQ